MYVETHSLTKHYAQVAALTQCSVGVQRGEVFGLLGPNGSGKTTLLRLLMGFLRPTAGTACIDTLDCYHDSVLVHSRVSYMPGDARLFRSMRGRDVLKFLSRVRGGFDTARGLALADRLGLDTTRPVGLMSTGMRQKLALAAAMAPDVPLLILDEPTSNLDPTVRSDVIRLIGEIKREGRTVIFSSHVLSEVERVCDRVAVLQRGRLVHTQVMTELTRQHRIKAQLLGPLPIVPAQFDGQLSIRHVGAEDVVIETPGELSSLLGWLAELPLAEVRIEPVGLQTIYDRFHPAEAE